MNKKMISKGLILSFLLLVATVFAVARPVGILDELCYEKCMKNNAGMVDRFMSSFMDTDIKQRCIYECTQNAIPDFCPAVYEPVCGFDGKTYSNKCFARMAGVTIKNEGVCEIVINEKVCCGILQIMLPGSTTKAQDPIYRWMTERDCKTQHFNGMMSEIVDDSYCETVDEDICCKKFTPGTDEFRYTWMSTMDCTMADNGHGEIVSNSLCEEDQQFTCTGSDIMITITPSKGVSNSFCVNEQIALWIESLQNYLS